MIFAYGLSSRICCVAVIDSIMQHTYPNDPMIVMSVFSLLQNLFAICFIEVGRQIIYAAGNAIGLVYMCGLTLAVFALSIVFKPQRKRMIAEESHKISEPCAVPLLSQSMNVD